MIAIALYIFIGLISGFITYWIGYRLCKERCIENYKNSRYRSQPTHDDVKAMVIGEDIIPIILSVIAWPVALFIIYPIIGFVIGTYKLFNWMIDRLEGRKYNDTTAKG